LARDLIEQQQPRPPAQGASDQQAVTLTGRKDAAQGQSGENGPKNRRPSDRKRQTGYAGKHGRVDDELELETTRLKASAPEGSRDAVFYRGRLDLTWYISGYWPGGPVRPPERLIRNGARRSPR
jgi:hypothetical protein